MIYTVGEMAKMLDVPASTLRYYDKELHDEPDGVYLISLNQKYRPIHLLLTLLIS